MTVLKKVFDENLVSISLLNLIYINYCHSLSNYHASLRIGKVSIEICCKIYAFGYAYLAHFTLLPHNQVGYYNSLILQALELPPLASRARKGPHLDSSGVVSCLQSHQKEALTFATPSCCQLLNLIKFL